jgi:poly(3-hydroxyalkanoate) synthetase
MQDAQVLEQSLGGGHIGCVISERHQKKLWQSCDEWLLKNREGKNYDRRTAKETVA